VTVMSTMRRPLLDIAAVLCLVCYAQPAGAQSQTAPQAAPAPAERTQEAPQPDRSQPVAARQPPSGSAAVARPGPQPAARGQRGGRAPQFNLPVEVDVRRRSSVSGFSVVLVAGEMKASRQPSADDIPAPARKALADMQAFLPFKTYQLLDVAWLLANQAGSGNTLRLRGPGAQLYQLDIVGPDRELGIGVKLSETNGPPENRLLLNTRFQMTAGESVVVGTSRLSGGNALILLLTAVPADQQQSLAPAPGSRQFVPSPESRPVPVAPRH